MRWWPWLIRRAPLKAMPFLGVSNLNDLCSRHPNKNCSKISDLFESSFSEPLWDIVSKNIPFTTVIFLESKSFRNWFTPCVGYSWDSSESATIIPSSTSKFLSKFNNSDCSYKSTSIQRDHLHSPTFAINSTSFKIVKTHDMPLLELWLAFPVKLPLESCRRNSFSVSPSALRSYFSYTYLMRSLCRSHWWITGTLHSGPLWTGETTSPRWFWSKLSDLAGFPRNIPTV